ncbi:MAG: hypothetical protein U0R78_01630 [Nocardioidaceae bacterium]
MLTAAAVVTTAVLVPAASGAPGAVAPAGWEPAVGLSRAGRGMVASEAAVSPLGDQAVVWVRGGDVRVALRPAGDTWAGAITIGNDAGSAVAAYDPGGRLLVAWAQHPDGGPAAIVGRTLGPAGVWGDPVVVAERATGSLGVEDLAVNGSGDAVLAWRWNTRGQVSRGFLDGGWSTTLRLPHAERLQVAIGDGGLAAVVAQQVVTSADDGLRVGWVAVRQPRGSAWGDPTVLQQLRDVGPPAPGPAGVFVDQANRTTVAWDARRPDGRWAVTALRAQGDGAWRPPRMLWRHRAFSEFPVRVTGAPSGRVLVTFAGPGSASVLAAQWDPSDGWSGPVTVTGAASYVNDWSVAMDPSGQAILVWTRSAGPGALGDGVRAALLASDGTWSAPGWLSREATPDGHARLAAMDDGTALAVWSEVTTGRKLAVMARSYVG